MTTGVIPDDFLPLAFMPLTIMYTAILVETIVAKFKGFNSTGIVVPSISLFNFGFRSLYTSMPKNRNDIFDTASIGVSVSLLYSLGALFAGLQITSKAAVETVAAYPSVSLALLNSNAVVSQLLSYMVPEAERISQSTAVATVAAAGAVVDPTVHLHWLAIAGAVSFIGSTLQLIPLDNSAGSKIGQAVVGNDPFSIVSAIFTVLKVLIILPMAFTLDTLGMGSKLVFDYFITSQLVGNQAVRNACFIVRFYIAFSLLFYVTILHLLRFATFLSSQTLACHASISFFFFSLLISDSLMTHIFFFRFF